MSTRRFNRTPFNLQHSGVDDGVRNLPAGRGDDIPERLPGYPHLLRRLLLIQTLQVG